MDDDVLDIGPRRARPWLRLLAVLAVVAAVVAFLQTRGGGGADHAAAPISTKPAVTPSVPVPASQHALPVANLPPWPQRDGACGNRAFLVRPTRCSCRVAARSVRAPAWFGCATTAVLPVPHLTLWSKANPGLAFSPDGRWLAIALDEGSGVRVLLWRPGLSAPRELPGAFPGKVAFSPPLLAIP